MRRDDGRFDANCDYCGQYIDFDDRKCIGCGAPKVIQEIIEQIETVYVREEVPVMPVDNNLFSVACSTSLPYCVSSADPAGFTGWANAGKIYTTG